MKAGDIVRLSPTLFPDSTANEETCWNGRLVRVKKLIQTTYIKDDSLWIVGPLWAEHEDDFIHVHQYEMYEIYTDEMETQENVPTA